ncbi:GMC oxidoreductase [Bombardia bombarda]|uniref:GMC oxidoreductase n=1 Tax=Bombardia bombarda TaxID=252184 RepID=A0AA39X8P9_9PEZI|nr:GMC oxidoreductase [Bombardia bombarda]
MSYSESYDVVIVGGGTAGLVLAARLSEDPSVQVLVVESGQDQLANPQVLTPAMWPMLSLPGSPLDWAFQTVPQEGLGNTVLTFPQGRLLGGSSGINSFLFTPTSQTNVDAWAHLGNKGWDFDTFSAAVKKSYTFHPPSGPTQGDGPLQLAAHVSEPEGMWTTAWIDALDTLGFPLNDPFSGRVCGPFPHPESVYPATKQRCFSANAYLGPARDRANLTVLTETNVTKILFSKGGSDASSGDKIAEGIQVTTKDGETRLFGARREVILAAGTINSPRLLELSGVGDAALLESLGIETVVNNPHVGENLQNHVYTGVVFSVPDDVPTLDPFFRQEPQAMKAAMEAYAKFTGPLGSSSIIASAQLPFPGIQTDEGKQDLDQLVGKHLATSAAVPPQAPTTPAFAASHESYVRSVLSSPTDASANYIIGPAFTAFEDPNPFYRAPGNHITVAVMLAHPLSRGSVHITSASPNNAGNNTGLAVNPRYLSHPLDLEVLARHVRFAEQAIGRAEPLARHFKPGQAERERFGDLEKAKEYVQKTAKGSHHYTGTCSMMPREMGGVVDEELKVYGVANLRVCDASIVPIEPRVNTQAVVYGVAEMGARLIKESLWPGQA